MRVLAAVLALVAFSAEAQVGRYQIVMPQNDARERFVLDTQTGMTWLLLQSPCAGANGNIPNCVVSAWSSVPYLKTGKDGSSQWWPTPTAPGDGYVAPLAK